jgi:hypothetical protein
VTTLCTLLIVLGFLTGVLLIVGLDIWPPRWLAALIVSFLATVGGVWAVAYTTRQEDHS